jgi:hypothetical protein
LQESDEVEEEGFQEDKEHPRRSEKAALPKGRAKGKSKGKGKGKGKAKKKAKLVLRPSSSSSSSTFLNRQGKFQALSPGAVQG